MEPVYQIIQYVLDMSLSNIFIDKTFASNDQFWILQLLYHFVLTLFLICNISFSLRDRLIIV